MRNIILLLAITAALGAIPAAAEESAVKRLDGSRITSVEVDEAVARLIRAAEVTGVGIAILKDANIVYLKTYGVRDKEKNLPLAAPFMSRTKL